jgi:hypothetical protein
MTGELPAEANVRDLRMRTGDRLLLLAVGVAASDLLCLFGLMLGLINFSQGLHAIIFIDSVCAGFYALILISYWRTAATLSRGGVS